MKLRPLFFAALLSSCGPEIPRMPDAPASALGLADLRADSDQRLTVLTAGATDNSIFANYSTDRPSTWGRNFTRRFDFTGVAWDDMRTATAVSPLHVIMAGHFQRQVGSALVFHDRSGRPQRRSLVAVESLQGVADVAVGKLDAPLPASVRPYRLLPPGDGDGALTGCLAVVTDQHRRVFLHEIFSVSGSGMSFRHAEPERVPPLLRKQLAKGDSGNPSFLLIGGELVLVETHTWGGPGAGAFLSSPPVFAAINAAMLKLGGGHTLATVPIGR
jgi:hypothetical protein